MTLSPKDNLLRALRFAEPEYVPYSAEGTVRLLDCRGRRPPEQGMDEWGVRFEPLPAGYEAGGGEPANSCAVAHPANSLPHVLSMSFPDPTCPALYAGLLDGVNRAEVLPLGQHPAGPLDRLSQLMGPMQAWVALLQDPETGRLALDRLADYHVGVARGYVAAGVEGGWIADDYAGSDGPFLRPALWRRLVLPGLRRIFDVYRAAGLPVFFHTCGRADVLIPDLIEAGAQVFNLESAAANLPVLRAQHGNRIAFYGGVSAGLMLRSGPDEVRQAARDAIVHLGQHGGMILAPDQPLSFPVQNEMALAETVREFGYYPLMAAV